MDNDDDDDCFDYLHMTLLHQHPNQHQQLGMMPIMLVALLLRMAHSGNSKPVVLLVVVVMVTTNSSSSRNSTSWRSKKTSKRKKGHPVVVGRSKSGSALN